MVVDHGSANAAVYTKENIESLGLKLWLCGIGRPTGNSRTERTIGTLKNEEIKLKDRYDEEKARRSIELMQRFTSTTSKDRMLGTVDSLRTQSTFKGDTL